MAINLKLADSKFLYLTFLLFYLITFIHGFAFGQNNEHLVREIFKLIRNETDIKLEAFPLMSIAVIDENSTEYLHFEKGVSVGNQNFQNQLIYEIGEVSQIYTSYLFYQLTLNGELAATDSINKYISFKENSFDGLTLNHLIMNTSGLPNKIIKDVFDEEHLQNEINTIEDIANFYKNPSNKIGSHSFNNNDYALLGHILSEVSKSSYLEKLNEFLPHNCQLLSHQSIDGQVLTGYNRIGVAVPAMEENLFFPANGIRSSIAGLSHLIQYLMLDSLNENYFNFVMAEGVENSRFDYVQRHRGWNSVEVNKDTKVLLQHGKTEGFTSFVAMYPKGKKAVVLLTNSSNTTEGLGFFILRMVSNYWKTN